MKHTILGFGCLLLMGLSWQVGAYDERDLQKLLETNDCEMCDLTRLDLTGENLTKTNLENVEYFGAADTTGAVFCKTIMPDASLNKSGR